MYSRVSTCSQPGTTWASGPSGATAPGTHCGKLAATTAAANRTPEPYRKLKAGGFIGPTHSVDTRRKSPAMTEQVRYPAAHHQLSMEAFPAQKKGIIPSPLLLIWSFYYGAHIGGDSSPASPKSPRNLRKPHPTCYTDAASNTTVVVRLLWFVPEFPPNFPP
jgi:hypothetical protein